MTSELTLAPNARLIVPYFAQWLGVWAMEESHLSGLASAVRSLDIQAHVSDAAQRITAKDIPGASMEVSDGIATISLNGTLMKHAASLGMGTSTALARRLVRQAANDPQVRGIMLHIDSPGGTVAGTKELADEVATATQRKPVRAHISDLGASAAYWIASQAQAVTANEMALIGSIGTYSVVQDLSGAAAKEGVKVHVIRAGAFKGMGTPGTEVTAEQLAEYQRLIDAMNAKFVDGVASGRKLPRERVAELADGRVHPATDAKSLGLIDSVTDFEAALSQFVAETQPKRGSKMQAEHNEVTPVAESPTVAGSATIAELKAACPGADASFLLAQLEAGATCVDAQLAFIAKQQIELKAALEAAEVAAKKTGVPPVGTQGNVATEAESDPCAAWHAAVQAKIATGMSRARATSAVVRENPELHQAFVACANQ